MRIFNILNCGAGIQSSRILLASCRGELPKFDASITADTMWEPKAVYANIDFLKGECAKAGIPFLMASAGNLRDDAVEFRRLPESADGKRYASIPTFIKNPDGKQGKVKRQCTKEYKIEVVERVIRREILGLAPKSRVPKDVLVRQWFGISADEPSRAVYPGRTKTLKKKVGKDLWGGFIEIEVKQWKPVPWINNVYPLLNQVWKPNRTIEDVNLLPRQEDRQACTEWLANNYPGRSFPRSACIGCPMRSNAEWKHMQTTAPEEWEDACRFDEEQRQADGEWVGRKKPLSGLSFVHRQLVPLRMADLDGAGEKGGGCGTLLDGMDGLCGL